MCVWFSVCVLNHVWLFVTPWTVALQAPLYMGFPRQEYLSELPFSSLGDLCDTGIKPTFPTLSGGFFTTENMIASLLNILQTYQLSLVIISFLTYFSPWSCSPISQAHLLYLSFLPYLIRYNRMIWLSLVMVWLCRPDSWNIFISQKKILLLQGSFQIKM